MGREIRRVPPNWQHPRHHEQRRAERGELQPMYDRHIDDALAEWLDDLDARRRGEWGDLDECYNRSLAAWLSDNQAPDPSYHRPWRDDEAAWFQVWETVSEGTPVTPPFAAEDELIEHLVAHGDDWDAKRGRGGWARDAAESFVRAGWAPSLVMLRRGDEVTVKEPRDGPMFGDPDADAA